MLVPKKGDRRGPSTCNRGVSQETWGKKLNGNSKLSSRPSVNMFPASSEFSPGLIV